MKLTKYLQRGRQTDVKVNIDLSPGVAAKRRLRAFKVYVLVHTR